MPDFCCVPTCSQKGTKGDNGTRIYAMLQRLMKYFSKVSFHGFPYDEILRNKWLKALNFQVGSNFRIPIHKRVCSLHFQDSDFLTTNKRRVLIEGSIPSVLLPAYSSAISIKPKSHPKVGLAIKSVKKAISSQVSSSSKPLQSAVSVPENKPKHFVYENGDFPWDDYLEQTKSEPVPSTAFSHVEHSLESGFSRGMVVEVGTEEGNYWVASITNVSLPLLRMRFLGATTSEYDFWINIEQQPCYSIGWSQCNGYKLIAPNVVKEMNSESKLEELLADAVANGISPPSEVLELKGRLPHQLICPDHNINILAIDAIRVHLARVKSNIGGRLLLQFDDKTEVLYYLSRRLLVSDDASSKMSIPLWIFKRHDTAPAHTFKEGQMIEALSPDRSHLCPAIIDKLLSDRYVFIRYIDKYDRQGFLSCLHWYEIFPVGFASNNDLPFKADSKNFSWQEYLTSHNATSAPDSCFDLAGDTSECLLMENQKLEVECNVNPLMLRIGTIRKVRWPLLLISYDDTEGKCVLESITSQRIFPVGWSAANSHPLKGPVLEENDSFDAEDAEMTDVEMDVPVGPMTEDSLWCPTIYFNHLCFTGPFLSKNGFSHLPKTVGPGPIDLVLNKLLNMLISAGYVQPRLLSELSKYTIPDKVSTRDHVVKGKMKHRSVKTHVKAVTRSEHVGLFCTILCKQLQCCKNLFGLRPYGEDEGCVPCPEKCNLLTKSRFNYMYMKKHNIPLNRASQVLRFQRKQHFLQHKTHNKVASVVQCAVDDGSEDSSSPMADDETDCSQPAWEASVFYPVTKPNLLEWSVDDVEKFVRYHHQPIVANVVKQQEIDGIALMLLNVSVMEEILNLKVGVSIKFCRLLEKLKIEYFKYFVAQVDQ